jgi:hypothetical protein
MLIRYSLHSFLRVHNVVAHFTIHYKPCSPIKPKQFFEAKLAYFDFLKPNFNVQDHILNTTRDVLISLGTT